MSRCANDRQKDSGCRARMKQRRNVFGLRMDQRGAVAFEAPFVFGFLFLALLMPLADLGVAGFKLIFGYEALRNAGQYMQYRTPPDVTSWGSWVSSLPSTVTAQPGYLISNIQVLCGDLSSVCSATNTASPKYYSFTTSLTLSPLVLRPVLCPTSCTFTLRYSERFQ